MIVRTFPIYVYKKEKKNNEQFWWWYANFVPRLWMTFKATVKILTNFVSTSEIYITNRNISASLSCTNMFILNIVFICVVVVVCRCIETTCIEVLNSPNQFVLSQRERERRCEKKSRSVIETSWNEEKQKQQQKNDINLFRHEVELKTGDRSNDFSNRSSASFSLFI